MMTCINFSESPNIKEQQLKSLIYFFTLLKRKAKITMTKATSQYTLTYTKSKSSTRLYLIFIRLVSLSPTLNTIQYMFIQNSGILIVSDIYKTDKNELLMRFLIILNKTFNKFNKYTNITTLVN